jgi:hypothetical protein
MDGGGVKVAKFTYFVTQKSFVNDLIKLEMSNNVKLFYKYGFLKE